MCQYVSHLLNIDFDFYNQHTTGDMISRLQDSNIVREAITKVIITITFDFIMMLVCLTVLACLNIPLFIITFIVILFYACFVKGFGARINQATEKLRTCDATASTIFLETVKGIETVKSYEYEEQSYKRNSTALSNLMDSYKSASLIFSKQGIISEGIIAIGQVLILSVGGSDVMRGNLTFGILFMFYSLLNMSMIPIKNIVDLFPTIDKAKVSAKRLKNVFSYPCESKNDTCISKLSGKISIKNLSYRYGNRELLLNDISINIDEGKQIAIIGNSGSGKSTLAKIILRLYKPETGEIYIDDIPIGNIPLIDLRNRIAYMSQTPYIFRGTILENIHIGNPNMNDQEIIEFLDKTPFKQFIKRFPMGYASMIYEGGENLSGGQKQMIALARAIIKRADIIILDEAFSSIDTNLHKIAESLLNTVYSKSTRIIITHNASEIRNCDQIIILDSGNIVDLGTHEELINRNIFYQEFCKF